jgi:Xaa-Pro aminopeptidase
VKTKIEATTRSSGGKRGASILFHADSSDPDMRHFSRFNTFDPYLAFTAGRKRIAVITANEYGRMVNESAFDEVLLQHEIEREAARRFKLPTGTKPDTCQLVRHLAKCYRITGFRVGSRFPAGLFSELQQSGVKITADTNGELLPERVCKTAAEVKALRKGNRASAAGFRVVARTLAEAKVRRGALHHRGRVLTSERLREMINHACLDAGAVALHTIAAAGDQVVDNHCVGHGPIRAGELIVVDIFPQRIEDGYWGDMTRTYLKGRASDVQRRLVRTVRRAHQLAIGMIKPGVRGGRVHEAVETFFAREGYRTEKVSSEPEGFFHSLGHCVGLEIHEEPIMRAGAKFRFRKGMVTAVEPGLYYRGLGGVRIEDVVHVVSGGNEKISSAPYKWEIA